MLEQIVQWFDQAGWLANAFGIGVPSFGALLLLVRVARAIRVPTDASTVLRRDVASAWRGELAKKFARIAIVDDQHEDFPVRELRKDGYNVSVYRHVSLADISAVSEYDIVFLDIMGVVKDDPDRGGLILIGELRKVNPTQRICAISSRQFDVTATEFFKSADDVKRKPMTAYECRAVIDEFLRDDFDARALLESVERTLTPRSRKIRIGIISGLSDYVQGRQTEREVLAGMMKSGLSLTEAHVLLRLARVAKHAS